MNDSTKVMKVLFFIFSSGGIFTTVITIIITIIPIIAILGVIASFTGAGDQTYLDDLNKKETEYEEKQSVEINSDILQAIDMTLNITSGEEDITKFSVRVKDKELACLSNDEGKEITDINETFDCLELNKEQQDIAKMQLEIVVNSSDGSKTENKSPGNFEDGELLYPYEEGTYTFTAEFGWYAPFGETLWHTGNDFVSNSDKEVYPASSGTVEKVSIVCSGDSTDCGGGYGNYIEIKHKNNDGETYYTKYAHFSSIYVEKGDEVTINTKLGHEGSTGFSTGSHLHFEVRIGGNTSSHAVDPQGYLSPRKVKEINE